MSTKKGTKAAEKKSSKAASEKKADPVKTEPVKTEPEEAELTSSTDTVDAPVGDDSPDESAAANASTDELSVSDDVAGVDVVAPNEPVLVLITNNTRGDIGAYRVNAPAGKTVAVEMEMAVAQDYQSRMTSYPLQVKILTTEERVEYEASLQERAEKTLALRREKAQARAEAAKK